MPRDAENRFERFLRLSTRMLSFLAALMAFAASLATVWSFLFPASASKHIPGVAMLIEAIRDVDSTTGKVVDATEKAKREFSEDPLTQLANWGYSTSLMSAEDILDSAIRNNRIAVAKTVLQTDEPLSQRLFWLSIIPNEIQFEVANHKFWRDHDEFCDFLHVDHILYGVLPTELENIEFMVNYCPEEGKELSNHINELLKQAAQVEIYNEPEEEMLRNARNDCNAFFLSSVFRRSVEQSLISYYQSNGQHFSDPNEYVLPNNLSGRVRYSGSSKWNPGVKSLRGSVSVGVIAVRGGKLINGPNRKVGSWSLEKRIVRNIEWAAQESCSRMEFLKKEYPEETLRAKKIRDYLDQIKI